jgi:hypothetical protein
MAIIELGEHLDAFCHCQLLKIAVAMALYRHSWPFKPKNHCKSFLGPYECKLQ